MHGKQMQPMARMYSYHVRQPLDPKNLIKFSKNEPIMYIMLTLATIL